MTLSVLKQKLQVLTGTLIGEVFFDWKIYTEENRSRTFPCVVWNLDGAEFSGDLRSSTIQQTEIITLTVFVIGLFDQNTQDKIAVWDTLKGYFKTYLNKMNDTAGIQILNIDKIKGQYLGYDVDKGEVTIGIMFKNVEIKVFC